MTSKEQESRIREYLSKIPATKSNLEIVKKWAAEQDTENAEENDQSQPADVDLSDMPKLEPGMHRAEHDEGIAEVAEEDGRGGRMRDQQEERMPDSRGEGREMLVKQHQQQGQNLQEPAAEECLLSMNISRGQKQQKRKHDETEEPRKGYGQQSMKRKRTEADTVTQNVQVPPLPTDPYRGPMAYQQQKTDEMTAMAPYSSVSQPEASLLECIGKISGTPSPVATNIWCLVYYYEFDKMVGDKFEIELQHDQRENPQLIIDGTDCSPPESTRLCLGTIGSIGQESIASVLRSFGKGLRLFQRDDNIYLENLSDSRIFVQCPLFARRKRDIPSTVYIFEGINAARSSTVESSTCLFDAELFGELLQKAHSEGYRSLFHFQYYCMCRISFVEGWGAQFQRQAITSCPAWIEVQFARALQILDKTLMECSGEIPETGEDSRN